MAKRGRPCGFDREQALRRALDVFWEAGYEGATMAALKEAMGGICAPSMYAAYGSKEALFRSAVELYLSQECQLSKGRHIDQIANNPILLYMKGSPNAPQCGFSSRAAQVLMACGEKFAYVDILQNPEIRANLPKYANWPTFPQLWVNGELVGGSDILAEMFEKGELQTLVKDAAAKANA